MSLMGSQGSTDTSGAGHKVLKFGGDVVRKQTLLPPPARITASRLPASAPASAPASTPAPPPPRCPVCPRPRLACHG